MDRTAKSDSESDSLIQPASSKTRIQKLKELSRSWLPLAAFLFDITQLTIAPFLLRLAWPKIAIYVFRTVAEVLFFSLDISGPAYQAIVHLITVLIFLCLSVLLIPTQILIQKTSDSFVTFLYFLMLCQQTILFMPSIRFLLSSFKCDASNHMVLLPDNECNSGLHSYYMFMSALLICMEILVTSKWQFNTYSRLEQSKRPKVYMFSGTSERFSIFMLITKACFAVPLSILEERVNPIVNTSILFFLTCTILGYLWIYRAYIHYFTARVAIAFLVPAVWTNFVGLIVAIEPEISSYASLVWVFLLLPLGYIGFHSAKFHQSIQFSTFYHDKLMKDGKLNLSESVIGSTSEMWMLLLDFISSAKNRIKSIDLSRNDLSPKQLRLIMASLAIRPKDDQIELVLTNNPHALEEGLELPEGRVVTLDISLCPVSAKCAHDLVRCGKQLRKLKMVGCEIDETVAGILGELIANNEVLESLNLSTNSIKVAGAKALAKGLLLNSYLKSLDLTWNQLETAGAKYIVDALPRTIDLKISCNYIPKESAQKLLDAFTKKETADKPKVDPMEELKTILDGKTIYEFIGGKGALSAVIDEFYYRLVTDHNIGQRFFKNVTMGRMRHLQESFLTHVLGGTNLYKGKDMKFGHAHLGISDDDFDQVVTHFFGPSFTSFPLLPLH